MALTAEIYLPPRPFYVLIMPNCHAFRTEIWNHSAILYPIETNISIALQCIFHSADPISGNLGCPPLQILQKFTRDPVPVSSYNTARDMTGPYPYF